MPSGATRSRTQRERTVGSNRSSLVGTQDQADRRRRLLERLEERVLGVLVHPLGMFDDRDPMAAFDRQVGQLGDQVANTTGDLPKRIADDDLTARALRTESVQVGVVAAGDKAAAAAGTTGSISRVGGKAEQAGRQVLGQGGLADGGRPDQEDGVGQRTHARGPLRRRASRAGPG